ncbi:unnamed protein product [Protopolystoma xenopodis]|uniref:Uncharacterized protein n=1 Tax=Protopolystoma xenopodis TaxID=117903 RepID=A0A448X8N1_9PLAT|nr:unnamed protein product [Protopolystoma xenopodis]
MRVRPIMTAHLTEQTNAKSVFLAIAFFSPSVASDRVLQLRFFQTAFTGSSGTLSEATGPLGPPLAVDPMGPVQTVAGLFPLVHLSALTALRVPILIQV